VTTRPLFWKRLAAPRPGLGLIVFALSLAAAGVFALLDGRFGDRSWALVAGVVFGIALQRGELSLVRAWRDLIALGDSGQLLGFLAALAVAATLTLGTLAALGLTPPATARIGPVHWLLPISGFAFGVACVIARGGDNIKGRIDRPGAHEKLRMRLAGIDDALKLGVRQNSICHQTRRQVRTIGWFR